MAGWAFYLAEDLSLRRNVALKFLHKDVRDPTSIERFRREARSASALNHPNICTIYEISNHDGQPFIAMEWLEGHSLKDLLQTRRLSIDEMVSIAIDVAAALDGAHRADVTHRDIKPANIFITIGGNAKLLDFGLAQIAANGAFLESALPTVTADLSLTDTGSTVGTVAYMSPEQARGERLDPRTDLFSFGVTLYEMAVGMTPFRGSSTAVVFHEILGKAPVPPHQLNPEVPPELDRLIMST